MIRVLVADDSAFMRTRISRILNADEEIEVIASAKTGSDAIKKVVQLKPDVVTMDLEMPDIDGLTALAYIMNEVPTPVVIISAHVSPGNRNVTKAMELGAVEVVAKPSGEISLDIDTISDEIVKKVKSATKVNTKHIHAFLNKLTKSSVQVEEKKATTFKKVVAIGASTGGPKAIKEILPYFSSDIDATFLIVQHMPAPFTKSMAERLNWSTKIKIKEAEDGDIIQAGYGYLAPGNYHMVVVEDNNQVVIRLNQGPKINNVRPSITVMMNSAAEVFGSKCIGVLLTGMGQDGVEGVRSIKRVGGETLAEDESTCVVFGMSRVAIEQEVIDRVIPLHHMGIEIMKLING